MIFSCYSVEDWEPTELKHLSRWRKRKQYYVMSLVTASEIDLEQTESCLVIFRRCGVLGMLLNTFC